MNKLNNANREQAVIAYARGIRDEARGRLGDKDELAKVSLKALSIRADRLIDVVGDSFHPHSLRADLRSKLVNVLEEMAMREVAEEQRSDQFLMLDKTISFLESSAEAVSGGNEVTTEELFYGAA